MSRFADIDEEAGKRLLNPLLKAKDRPTGAEMFAVPQYLSKQKLSQA